MRILGIDPGSLVTGYGVVERRGAGLHHVAHGTLRPPRVAPLAARLAAIHAGIAAVIESHAPVLVVVEKVFVAANPRAALVLGQARGVVLAAAAAAGVRVDELSPQAVKLAVVGTGAAQKLQVQRMVQRLLALEERPAQDAADALAAAWCAAQASPRLGRVVAELGAAGALRRARRPRGGPRPVRFVLRRVQ